MKRTEDLVEADQALPETILGLKLATDTRWADLAAVSLEEILADHAFCEQKAATTCISLVQRYAEKADLVDALSPVITEEWGHFRMVWAEMKKRGFSLGRQRKDEYVNLLINAMPKGLAPEEKLLHRLMLSAMIEARSCERFKVLSLHLEDEYLRKFYHKFMVSEAGHFRLFIDLAEQYFPQMEVQAAWKRWVEIEADILEKLTPKGNRMH